MFQKEELNSMQVLKRDKTTSRSGVVALARKEMIPYDFEKHSQRVGPRKWEDHIWVILNDEKVPLSKTCLIKYYKHIWVHPMRSLPAAAANEISTVMSSSPVHCVRKRIASASEPRRIA
ncbi:hypothetical protein LWI29_004042 [Acer saccharum]|uniref:ULTRAPETALA1/2 SAND domain-containing protein n=1 Tax=Acer saccharum TaxID=4024 RepID=A0AA39T2C1_ACESA|nr:hypothetical protein LWI29_004042 [Acer saccharum]